MKGREIEKENEKRYEEVRREEGERRCLCEERQEEEQKGWWKEKFRAKKERSWGLKEGEKRKIRGREEGGRRLVGE